MSAPRDLARLIARYRFLQGEPGNVVLAGKPTAASAGTVLDDVFMEIVRFKAEDPVISYRQIEFLLAILADGRLDADLRQLVSTEALAHVRRLVERAALPVSTMRA